MAPAKPLHPHLMNQLCSAPSVFLFLDYDGTLVPIVSRPELAVPSPALLDLLDRLSLIPGWKIAVVSGRPILELQKLLPCERLFLVGIHGLEIRTPPGEFLYPFSLGCILPDLKEIKVQMEAILENSPEGFWVEDKTGSLAVHYRQVNEEKLEPTLNEIRLMIAPYLKDGRLEILGGKKVLEVRPANWDKGRAVDFLLRRQGGGRVLACYIGDDTTDEDAFHLLQKKGITIIVSPSPGQSQAQWFLKEQEDVISFLEELAASKQAKI